MCVCVGRREKKKKKKKRKRKRREEKRKKKRDKLRNVIFIFFLEGPPHHVGVPDRCAARSRPSTSKHHAPEREKESRTDTALH